VRTRKVLHDDRPLLLVLRALKLGDFLTAVPALRALADAFPDHRRVLAAPSELEPLARQLAATEELLDTRELCRLSRDIGRPDVAVDLHGRGPASQPLLLELEPTRLVAFEHPEVPATSGMPLWVADEHEVRRWCRLLSESGIPADPGRIHLDPPNCALPPWAYGATVVHPGAASGARRWPAERFASIIELECEAGREVVITGSPEELALARRVASLAGLDDEKVLAGRTGLLEQLALVGAAGMVVCGDTGVAHMATATSTPSVVLFGPVSPHEWGPPPQGPHRALWAGRRGDPHASTLDPGLGEITVEQTWAAMEDLRNSVSVGGVSRPSRPGRAGA
jgi:ADP-heptose:LPS heptosyltransferase